MPDIPPPITTTDPVFVEFILILSYFLEIKQISNRQKWFFCFYLYTSFFINSKKKSIPLTKLKAFI